MESVVIACVFLLANVLLSEIQTDIHEKRNLELSAKQWEQQQQWTIEQNEAARIQSIQDSLQLQNSLEQQSAEALARSNENIMTARYGSISRGRAIDKVTGR